MTSFSILFDPTQGNPIGDPQKALSYISYIGSGLSIVGLILTIVTFALFRCLNRHNSGKILLNLCSSMTLLHVSFLLGAFRSDSLTKSGQIIEKWSSTGNEEVNVTVTLPSVQGDCVCMAVAVFTHYFLLSTMLWMTVEAVNTYHLFVSVFVSTESHFLLKRSIVAWGAPAVIVGVTVAVDSGYYNSINQTCVPSAFDSYVYYLTLFGPCCLLLLVNIIIFVMVARAICQPCNERPNDGVTWTQVRVVFTVMTLLGITWVFGAFAVSGNEPVREVFQYIFCVLNSPQGFLLFVFRCIFYPEACSAWLMLFHTGTLKTI